MYHAVRRAGERAGVGWPVGLHALRHSYATIMHLRGVPKEQIRNALGHHSWEFTESVYVHDDSIPAAGVLAGLAGGQSESARSASESRGRASESVGNTWATRPTETGRDDLAAVEVGTA